MAPKSNTTGDIEESDHKHFNFDGDPLNRYPWAKYLEKRVYAHDSRFRTHIQYGYHMTGYRTITQSIEHSQNLYHRNVAKSTWADPACMDNWQYLGTAPASSTLPSEAAGNYTESPHDCDAIDKAIIEFILSTVTDETEKDDMEDECNGDARTLILNIQAYRPPAEVGTWALAKRTRVVSTGIEVPSVKGFNTYRTWYNLYNEQCHVPDPPGVSAAVFKDALRNLGEFLSGKLDYELLKSSAGTDPVKVIKAIKEVLTRYGAAAATGTALQMSPHHDPRRSTPTPKGAAPESATPRVWVDGQDELCNLCTRNPFDTGAGPRKHLRKHCREFKPKSGKKGSSKAAGAATDGEDDSDDDDDEAAAAAFYAEEDSVGVQGEDV